MLVGTAAAMAAIFIKEIQRTVVTWGNERKAKKHGQLEERYAHGLDLVAGGRLEEATACFEEILKKEPQHPGATTALGDVHYSCKKWDKAIEYHSQARSITPANIRLMLKLGRDYAEADRRTDAIEILSQLTQIDGDNLTGFVELGKLYLKQGKPEQAYNAQCKVVNLTKDPNRKEKEQQILLGLKCELAGEQSAQGDDQNAIRTLKDVLHKDKRFVPAYIKLAEIYQKGGALDEAISTVERGYRSTPCMVLLQRLEELALAEEQPQEAISAYRQAIGRAPDDLAPALALALLYFKLEMLDEAEKECRYLLSHGKDFPLLHQLLAEIYFRSGRFEESCGRYKHVLQKQRERLFRYVCNNCGAEKASWEARCTSCGQWNSLVWQI